MWRDFCAEFREKDRSSNYSFVNWWLENTHRSQPWLPIGAGGGRKAKSPFRKSGSILQKPVPHGGIGRLWHSRPVHPSAWTAGTVSLTIINHNKAAGLWMTCGIFILFVCKQQKTKPVFYFNTARKLLYSSQSGFSRIASCAYSLAFCLSPSK